MVKSDGFAFHLMISYFFYKGGGKKCMPWYLWKKNNDTRMYVGVKDGNLEKKIPGGGSTFAFFHIII